MGRSIVISNDRFILNWNKFVFDFGISLFMLITIAMYFDFSHVSI